jgi:hypothetical protein
MLGLGASMMTGGVASEEWTPASVNNLTVWLKFNTNIASSVSGTSTSAGDMADNQKISSWNAFGDTTINAVQSTEADMPRWEADAADVGGLKFTSGIKYMDFSSNITIAQNADFSIAFRLKALGFGAVNLIGSTDTEFFRINSSSAFRLKIDGSTNRNIAEASDEMADDTYYTVILSRTNGSTGDLNIYVNGGSFSDKDWDAAENATDNAEVMVNNLGADSDDSDNFNGFMKDVLIWNGTALSAGDRAALYTYLDAQE